MKGIKNNYYGKPKSCPNLSLWYLREGYKPKIIKPLEPFCKECDYYEECVKFCNEYNSKNFDEIVGENL